MVYYIKNCRSKIVHLDGCCHIKNTDKADIGTFPNLSKAYSHGYRLCNHCNLMQKKFKSEKEKIFTFCQQYGFSYRQDDRIATVTTTLSKWKIVLNNTGERLELYHRNSYDKKGDTGVISNYHFQHATYDTITGFLDYIYWHDVYRKSHPLESSRIYPKLKSPPPMKGTKRYRKEQKMLERKERKKSIANVLSLIESLQTVQSNSCPA